MGKALPLMASLLVALVASRTGAQEAPAGPLTEEPSGVPTLAPEAPPAATPSAPSVDPREQASYDLQLHELEDRLNELKEDVFASKARLRMLWHQLMQDRIGGSRIAVEHVNELGGLFDLVRVSYALDGNLIFSASTADTRGLAGQRRIAIYDEPAVAGPHTLVVQAEVRGNAHGMFAYMNDYEYSLVSSHSFTIDNGKTAEVRAVLSDQGGSSRELNERLEVRYDVELYDTVDESVSAAEDEGGDAR